MSRLAAVALTWAMLWVTGPAYGKGLENVETGQACGEVTVEDHTAGSDCMFHIEGDDFATYAETMFGRVLVARCDYEFDLAIGADEAGTIGNNQLRVTDGDKMANCLPLAEGIYSCTDATAGELGRQPDWSVQFEALDRRTGRTTVGLCLENTFLGTIAGELPLQTKLNRDREIVIFDARFAPLSGDAYGGVLFLGRWIVDNGRIAPTP